MAEQIESPWSLDDHDLLGRLHTTTDGLTSTEAARRLADAPPPLGVRRSTDLELLVRQFRSPILWLLMAAAVLSAALGETTDAAIIAVIVAASGVLGFVQERGAVRDVEALLGTVRVHAHVRRDGALVDLTPVHTVVTALPDTLDPSNRVQAGWLGGRVVFDVAQQTAFFSFQHLQLTFEIFNEVGLG